MSQLNINNAVGSTINAETTISSQTMEAATGNSQETIYTNPDASIYWGLFTSQPDLQTALLLKSYWTCGGGYTCDLNTDTILNNISGWGKETFFDVLFSMDVNRNLFGNSYAHLIYNGEDKSPENLLNIKVLSSETMSHVLNEQGIIIRYEQRQPNGKIKKFKPEEILHLTCNRIGDNVTGISRIAALKDTVEAYNEIDKIIRKVANHTAQPIIIWKLKTDNATVISNFRTRVENARKLNNGNDIFIPDDSSVVSFEMLNVSPNQLLMEWKNTKRDDFYRAVQLPQIMPGSGGDNTESNGKAVLLAHEMLTTKDRLAYERQIKAQLGLTIKIIEPPSIQPDLQQDQMKDGAMAQMNFQPSDTIAGVGR